MKRLLFPAFALLAAIAVACGTAPSDTPTEQPEASAAFPAAEAAEATDTGIPLQLMQGEWVHEQDSLALVAVSGTNWTDRYGQYPGEEIDSYAIILTDSLPPHAAASETTTYLLQVSPTDTTFCTLEGLTDSTLSLMHLPSGRLHLYLKRK